MRTGLLAGLWLLAACASEGMVIGPEGGTITVDAVTLDVPAGALDEDVEVAIAVDPDVEAESEGLTAVFAFTPHGQRFLTPATVTFEHEPGELPLVQWSEDALAWSILSNSTASSDTRTVAEIEHFSWGYVSEGMDGMMMR